MDQKPTAAMIAAGMKFRSETLPLNASDVRCIFQAMIDTAVEAPEVVERRERNQRRARIWRINYRLDWRGDYGADMIAPLL